ncbi:hypothetical protein [Polyangium fumosum]|uniref:ATP-binding protein n=1 Tax=Polyangium fumosum TaxID=889272 RepID=A0A4U1IEI1_9BACT|nr:hypothetical protein [Polyangium fumosum]TKC92106.1 hypothetical protein E8A74_50405 [Polyangium fumosum]
MSTGPAKSLDEAYDLLDPRPLLFTKGDGKRSAASDARFYTELPQPDGTQLSALSPMARLKMQLMRGGGHTKVFLSGHVGSGKSTQINRLAADPDIVRAFEVVTLRFESQEWDVLDGEQVQFRIAAVLYEWGNEQGLLDKQLVNAEKKKRWKTLFEQLESAIYGATGITVKEAKVGGEIDLVVGKLKQELTLSEGRRKQLRELGETQESLLRDLVAALVHDIEGKLSERGQGRSLLLLVDDLDKVARAESQKDIFERSLNTLLQLPLRVLYTVPSGFYFGSTLSMLRQPLAYLYPIRILHKAPQSFDPEQAFQPDQFGFFKDVLHSRVEAGLFEEDAIRIAAIYSGGVLRDFFHLLREAILVAEYNKIAVVDKRTMKATIADARLRESPGLYAPDFDALAHVHRTNELRQSEDRRYLDEGRVVECYNGKVWFEVNPLLWAMLEGRP